MSWTSSAPRTLLIEDRITHDTAWLFWREGRQNQMAKTAFS